MRKPILAAFIGASVLAFASGTVSGAGASAEDAWSLV
jgi:hypothetical protein